MLNIFKSFSLPRITFELKYFLSYQRNMYKNEDNRLDTFQRICDEIGEEPSYINKAKILGNFFKKGSDKKGFKGDLTLWVEMLIPGATQRVYNMQNKQMVKLFSRIFGCDADSMHLDLEQTGDVSETLCKFFGKSKGLKPQDKSTLYLQEVEEFLSRLEQVTKEDEQSVLLKKLCKEATPLDLRTVVRLIKQDLRINARARHILDALGPLAYTAYQSSRDLKTVVRQFSPKNAGSNTTDKPKGTGKLSSIKVMTPISPMLANACKSVEDAFKKSPGGLYSEIKYDGERVQIHKSGKEYRFFSRNLKPVMDHKVKRFKEIIPKAFPECDDMILDSEIILVDTKTGELLPFGTLGAHKKKEYSQAEVCLFVFDCLLFNGEDLTNLKFQERRKILEENIKPIKSYVQLSESYFLKTKNELSIMTAKVLKANLEGVVLKNPTGTYQPGKRGWLKVKKDYLFGGKMADTADLVVLGGWYGSGKKGGILSIFLMGCFDPVDRMWKTVTKVHSGLDDATNEEVHTKLMDLMERADPDCLPSWLLCNRPLVPDFIAKQPKDMPVWEITGAEFTKSEAHTAAGISIRFPRITKLRDDKSAEQANDLSYLKKLFDASKTEVNVDLLIADWDETDFANVEDIGNKLMQTPKKEERTTDEKASSSKKSPKKRSLDVSADKSPSTSTEKRSKIETSSKPESSSKKKPSDLVNGNVKKSKNKNTEKLPKIEHFFKQDKQEKQEKSGKSTPKQTKLNFSAQKVNKTTKESDIFNDVVAYFDGKAKDEECIQKFKSNGGTVTDDPKSANTVFYNSTIMDTDLATVREKYKPSSRHLSIQWLHDSLEKQTKLDTALYALTMK